MSYILYVICRGAEIKDFRGFAEFKNNVYVIKDNVYVKLTITFM